MLEGKTRFGYPFLAGERVTQLFPEEMKEIAISGFVELDEMSDWPEFGSMRSQFDSARTVGISTFAMFPRPSRTNACINMQTFYACCDVSNQDYP